MQSDLERTQDRLRAAEVVIMALYHRIEALETYVRQLMPYSALFEQRELKYDHEGLRMVVKDVKTWE